MAFQPPSQPLLTGVLTRYNKRTVTVVTDGGARWNVAPGFLQPIRDEGSARDMTNAVLRRDAK